MVDLVDLEAHRLQRLGQPFQELAGARQALVVVAGLVQVVRGVHQLQLAGAVALEQAELRLQAGVEGPALVAQALHLLLQHVAAVVGPGLVLDVADAHHPAVARLPGHRGQGRQVALGHEVRAVGLHAHAADGEAGKAGAGLGDRLQAADRHRLGLGGAMDVDKLRQHILDAVLVDDFLGFAGQHGRLAPRSLMLYSAGEIYFHQKKCKHLANLCPPLANPAKAPQSFYLYGKDGFIAGKSRASRGRAAPNSEHSWCEIYILDLKECRPA
ncbi:hypothetical protein D3C78_980710 [compost metagenome]